MNEKHYVEELLENWPPLPAHRPPCPRDGDPHEWWAAYERAMSLDSGPVD